MLALLFSLGDDRYALPAAVVVEVTPRLRLKRMPTAPDYVAGLCSYRGSPLPVLDLCALARGIPCRPLLSTRMIVAEYAPDGGEPRLLGLLAERATDTARLSAAQLQAAGIRSDDAPWLGKVAVAPGELVQLVDVAALLTPEAAALLYREAAAP